jgi:hypothetical protein
MKKLLVLFTLMMTVQLGIFAQCNVGSYTVIGNQTITGSCTITGDLTLPNGTTLNVDLSSVSADTFVVQGNILLEGNSVLWIHASPGSTTDQFIVSNSYSGERQIITKDSSTLQLECIEFRTQEGDLSNAASIYMSCEIQDRSIFHINESWLNSEKAWLLCNLQNKATLIADDPIDVPTEIYLKDSVQMVLHGSNPTVWLKFENINDTLNLPTDQTQPFSWQIGKGFGGLNTEWYLEVNSGKPTIGVEVFPSAQLTVNGAGTPGIREAVISLFFANGTDTLENLNVGLQNTMIANGLNGSLALNNVNLVPVAWQVYALMNENLHIKNSIINEIGAIIGPSQVTVDSSLIQLAVLAAVGAGGSSMTINDSEIWSQAITVDNNSDIVLNNCNVHGSTFSTVDMQSHITVNGGCFFQNPAGCTNSIMINWATGQPYCNPFIPQGFPQILTPATITLNGVNNNCITEIDETLNGRDITVFPNPSKNLVQVDLPNHGRTFSIEVYSSLGQLLLQTADNTVIDISNFVSGIYIFLLRQGNNTWTTKIVKE